MPDDVLVRCEHVSKRYCRHLRRSLWYGVRDIAGEFLSVGRHSRYSAPVSATNVAAAELPALRAGEFWANQDVSFEASRGECCGLIGRNGAGKTTLLKMLNGLIKPDAGRIELRGRVGALIALGAGFNSILTGRENISVNGAILGLSQRQIADRLDEIVDFAEIHDFVDAPVRTYSSGMQVRLGFAIAAVLIRPDILLLDEVLAVGDIGFVIKCLNAVRKLAQESAVLLVSHNMQHIAHFCTRVCVLDQGRVVGQFTPGEGIAKYYEQFTFEARETGAGGACVEDVRLRVDDREVAEEGAVPHGSQAHLEFTLDVGADGAEVEVNVALLDRVRVSQVMAYLQHPGQRPTRFGCGKHRVAIELGQLELNLGRYAFIIAIIESASGEILYRSNSNSPFRVEPTTYTSAMQVRYVEPTRLK